MTSSSVRILVTEDDPLMLNTATHLLTSAGYEVIPAINGEETLQLVQDHHPELMLLDVNLPDIEGTEICRRIKADVRTADIFVILLSGVRTGSDEPSDAMEGVADGYITRPVGNRELLARIQTYLRIKTAEQGLKEYSRQYENLYNLAPVGYFSLKRDGTIEKTNFAGAKLLGFPGQELIQQRFGLFVSVTQRAIFNDFLEKVFTSRNKETCEVALQGEGTASLWVQIEAILDSDETCQAVVSDITERSQIESQREISINALRESEERLAFVLEGSQLGYWDWNIVTGEVQRNQRWAEMLGYTLDEIKLNVKQWTDLQHPDDRAIAWKSIQDHLEGRTPIHKAEYRMLTKDGNYKWILDCARIVKYDAQGCPLRMSGTHTDITERKQAEVALQEEKANLDAIFESSPVAMFILDDATNIVKLNTAAVLLTSGSESDALRHRPGEALRCIHSSEDPRGCGYSKECKVCAVRNGIEALIAKGGAIHGVELILELLKNGTPQKVWMNIGAEPIQLNGRRHVCIAMDDITERKQAEEAIRQNERRLHEAQAIGRIGDWEIDMSKGQLFYSTEMFELLERDPALGPPEISNAMSYLEPEEAEKMQQVITRAMATGEGWELDVRVILPSKKEVWHHEIGSVIKDSEGNVLKILGVAQDITARKQTEEQLAYLNQQLELILGSAAEGILGLDLEGKHTFVNPAAANMLGYEVQELIGKRSHDTWHHTKPDGSSYPEAECQIKATLQTGTAQRVNSDVFWRKNGTNFAVEYASTPIFEQGKLTGAVVTFIDITERKRAETALRESEERYKIMFETASLAINMTRGTEIIYANPSYLAMFGFSSLDEVKGLAPLELFVPESRSQILENIQRRAQGLPVPNSYEVECFRKDGTRFPVLMHLTRTTFADGPATIGFILDITERKQAENKLRHARKFLRSIQDALSTNLAVIDQDGVIVQVNSRWREFGSMNGLKSIDYCLGMNYLAVCDSATGENAEEARLVAQDIRDVLTGGKKEARIEYPCHSPGERRWFSLHITKFEDGEKSWAVLAHENITERKMAEHQALERAKELRAFFNLAEINARDGISLDGLYQEFTDILPQSWQYVENAFARMVMGEREYRTKNFRESAWTQSAPIRVNGAVIGMVEVGYVDKHPDEDEGPFLKEERELIHAIAERIGQITERKQADQALQISESRYRQAITAAGAVPYYRDYQGERQAYTFIGEGILELTGYAASEITPAIFAELEQEILMRGSLAHLTADEAGRLSEIGEIQHWVCDYRIQTRAGQTRWCSDAAIQVRDENNQRIGVIGILQDITERKLAEQALEEHNRMLMAIQRVALEIGVELHLPILLKNILEHVQSMLDADRGGGIYLYDAGEHVIRLAQGSGVNQGREGTVIQMNEGVAGRVFQTSQPVIVDDYTHWDGRATVLIPDPSSTVMGVPLFQKGQVIGVLVLVANSQHRKFTNQDVKRVEMFAAQAAVAIQNARLFERAQNEIHERKRTEDEMQQRVTELEMLYESGLMLNHLPSPSEIGEKIIALLEQKMDWHHTIIRLYRPQDEKLEIIALSLPDAKSENEQCSGHEQLADPIFSPSEGLSGWAIQNKQIVRSHNVNNDPRYKKTYPGIQSGLYVPLKVNENVIGVISIESEKLNAFTDADERLVATLANQAAVAIENARLTMDLEQRVKERTAEVQDLYDNAPTGYHSLDANGTIVMINQTELDWLGYTREEVVGLKTFRTLCTPQSQKVFDENFPRFKAQGWIKDLEFELIRKDGSTFPILLNATAIYDANGNYLHSRSTLFDITERKRVEEEARTLFHAIEHSPVSVVIADQAGMIEYVNPRFCEATGYTQDEAIGKNPRILQSGLHSREFYQTMWATLLAGEPWHGEICNRRKDGKLFWEYAAIAPIKNEHREITHYVAIKEDITERKRAEEALRASRDELSLANAALEKAARLKDEFLASMSHELRTPLTGILGLSEALQLKTYGELTDKQISAIVTIQESGRHLLDLINDILDLSKIEAGKLELQFAPCSVSDICQASLQLTKGMAHQKGQNVIYTPLLEPVLIRADARRLKQILVNLLSNAVKFTPEGGELGLEVRASESDRLVKLIIWDKGIGIKPENLPKLFKPFTQLDSSLSREYSGTGLGLSLVQRLTEMHNGGIEVESTFGEGSRFTISLPWSPQNTTPISYEYQRSTARVTRPLVMPDRTNSPKVLVADDNEVVLQMIGDFLESRHYYVIKARSGFELLDLAEEFHPQVILVDIQMPGMDGLETIRRIRANPEPLIATAWVIVITAMAMPGDREACLRAGANEYMSKPLRLKELATSIEKQVEKKP
mgnify:FL=1